MATHTVNDDTGPRVHGLYTSWCPVSGQERVCCTDR